MTSVLAAASLGVDTAAVDVPAVPGFIASSFNPLVYGVARQCLLTHEVAGERTAIVLGTLLGDTTTTDLHSRRLIDGQVHNPLLFMQATANSVLGYLAAEFAVTGPAVSLSAWGDPVAPLLETAELLLAEGRVDHVLVIGVELAGTARAADAWPELTRTAPAGPRPPDRDLAVALLLGAAGPALPTIRSDGRDGVRGLLRPAEKDRNRPQGANLC